MDHLELAMVSHVANLGSARCVTEGDVEQNQILPLLTASEWMNVPLDDIKNKHYMPQRDIGKGANIKRGYVPDFAIWIDSIPVLIVEAKSPTEDAAKGFSEARLYAHAINATYPTGINPIRFVLSMNGQQLILGYWDSNDPIISAEVGELKIGTLTHDTIIEAVTFDALKRHASDIRLKFKPLHLFMPLHSIGGDPVANRKIPFNSFANDLVPLIRKYFESDSPEGIDDIIQRAYVSSDEITKYDAILETFLKENISHLKMPSAKSIETTKTKEHTLTPHLRQFSHHFPHTGHIQLIIGSVGSGKSLFTQRYYRYLQPSDVSDSSLWAFIDFNRAPDDLSSADAWLCAEFVESMAKENPSLDLEGNARAVFAPNILKLRKLYGDAVKSAPATFELEAARELVKLTNDPVVYAKAVCRYIIGDKRKAIICVIDNVDRRDRDQQLRIFQLAQWFRSETRTFCILALRDETYERYKDEPPLDAFSNAIHFTITPPRFINVVKKRLDLCLEYLIDQSVERRSYQVTGGITISYPKSKLGIYLKTLYASLFATNSRASRILEALSGRNVRRSLEMFTRILMSGHLDERRITGTVFGSEEFYISDAVLINILMKTDYLYFKNEHGFLTNIFYTSPEWQRPSNLLVPEALYAILSERKVSSSLGIQGYIRVRDIVQRLQKLGFVEFDIMSALAYLQYQRLITPDHMRRSGLTKGDFVRIHSSGYIHFNVLAARREYVAGVLPSTYLCDRKLAEVIGSKAQINAGFRDMRQDNKGEIAALFCDYLKSEYNRHADEAPMYAANALGAVTVIRKVEEGIRFASSGAKPLLSARSEGRLS